MLEINMLLFILSLEDKYKANLRHDTQDKIEALMGQILKYMLSLKLPEYKVEMKNSKDSICYRQEGNRYFVSGDDTKAIEYYTKSLAYADNQELMAYARGNRSASLYRMHMLKECITDIDAALSLGYPKEKCRKLTDRRVKILAEIQKTLKIKVSPPEDDKTLGSIFGKNDNTHTSKEIKEEIYKMIMSKTECIKKPRYLVEEGKPKLVYGPSKEAPVASDGVEIAFSETFGRHFIATREFNPGDVLTIEKPYVCTILMERFYTHCHHCLRKNYNLIPCPVCPIAQYCSEECRKVAWNSVHKIECHILRFLMSVLDGDKLKIRTFMKTLRFFINVTKGGKAIKELRQDMELANLNKDKRTAGFTDEGIFDTVSARSALSLTTNITGLRLIAISAFSFISGMAGILLATQTDFFGKRFLVENLIDSEIFPDLAFSGAVLLRGCMITCCNSFSIEQDLSVAVGCGLYIVHSLYNHSCEPNTFWHFDGQTIITRALGQIRPDEQIFTNYGLNCATLSKTERKRKIEDDYFFDCYCPACLYDWPTHEEILKNHIGSIMCNKRFSEIFSLTARLAPFEFRLLENQYDIEAIKSVLQILNANATKPCEDITSAEMLLENYYLDL